MLFPTKLVVLGKSVYQIAFLSFENWLNVDLSFSCLGSLTLKTPQIFYFLSNHDLISSTYKRKEAQIRDAISF